MRNVQHQNLFVKTRSLRTHEYELAHAPMLVLAIPSYSGISRGVCLQDNYIGVFQWLGEKICSYRLLHHDILKLCGIRPVSTNRNESWPQTEGKFSE